MNFFGKAFRGLNAAARKPLAIKCVEEDSPPSSAVIVDSIMMDSNRQSFEFDAPSDVDAVDVVGATGISTDDDETNEDTDNDDDDGDITDDTTTTEEDSGIAEESQQQHNDELDKLNSFTELVSVSGESMTLAQGESLNSFFTYW